MMALYYFILGQVGWSKSFFVVDCNCGKHGAHLDVLAVLGAAFDTLEPGVDPHMETLALLVHLLGNMASTLHLWAGSLDFSSSISRIHHGPLHLLFVVPVAADTAHTRVRAHTHTNAAHAHRIGLMWVAPLCLIRLRRQRCTIGKRYQ